MNLDDYESFYTDEGTAYIRKDEVVHSTSYRAKPIPPKAPQNGANELCEGFKLGIRWDLIAINCKERCIWVK